MTTRSEKIGCRMSDVGYEMPEELCPLISGFLEEVPWCRWCRRSGRLAAAGGFGIKPIERLVPVSSTHCCASTSGLSTWWSTTALMGRTHFEGGFPLRCFQRLSRPHIATRRCRGRDNRYTRGASIPVLSY